MNADKLYNEMVFSTDKYFADNEEEARSMMWKDIADFLRILTSQQYVAVVYDDDTDIIVVQFEHDEHVEGWGCPNPYWLTSKEAEDIYFSREDDCDETAPLEIEE